MDAAFIAYGSNGKPYGVSLRIEENIEDMVRFVASTLEYSLTDVYKLNIVEFFRDFLRAKEVVRIRKKMAEKWQKT